MGLKVHSNLTAAEGQSPTRRSGAPAPHPLLRLQQAAGNAAVAQLVNAVQRAPSDGPPPGEKPETGPEADEKTRAAALRKQRKRRKQRQVLSDLRARAEVLRQRARSDPAAVDELRRLYQLAPDFAVNKLAKDDPVAAQVRDARLAQNREAKDIRAGRKTTRNLPHDLEVIVNDRNGKLVERRNFTSGGMEKKPRTKHEQFKASKESHTEAKATREVALKPGQTMFLHGQKAPCTGTPSCSLAMQAKANSSGATLIYVWSGGPPVPGYRDLRGLRFDPVSHPSTPATPKTSPISAPPVPAAPTPGAKGTAGATAPGAVPTQKLNIGLGNLRLPPNFARQVAGGAGRAGLMAVLALVMGAALEAATAKDIERQIEKLHPNIEEAIRKHPQLPLALQVRRASPTPPQYYVNILFDVSTDFYLDPGPPPHHSYGAPVVYLRSVQISLLRVQGDAGMEFERYGLVQFQHQYFVQSVALEDVLKSSAD
jgi:Pput_2613-like deaminase